MSLFSQCQFLLILFLYLAFFVLQGYCRRYLIDTPLDHVLSFVKEQRRAVAISLGKNCIDKHNVLESRKW